MAVGSHPDQNRASHWFWCGKEEAEDLAEDEFFDDDRDRE